MFPSSSRKTTFVCALVLLVALGVFTFFRERTIRVVSAKADSKAPTAKIAAQSDSPDKRIGAEVIILRPNGFEPAQITRPNGMFLLAIDNQTGLKDVTLRLERANGVREAEVQLPGHRVRWRKRVNLSPGDYVVKVAGHPEWVCRLAITTR
jgi:hypothetical protein